MSKTVVIIGGGPGGSYVCSTLKGTKGITTVLINPNSYHVLKYTSLRGVGSGGNDGSHALIPLKNCTDRLVLGKATGINSTDKVVSVTLNTGETEQVKYDYLVCATGSWNSAVPTTRGINMPLAAVKSYYDTVSGLVKDAKNVVVIGGGVVGVELAGEIRHANATATVTILQRGKQLINSKPPVSEKFLKGLDRRLSKKKIDVKFTSATNISKADFDDDKSYLAGDRELQLEDGSTLKADIVFWCVGNTVLTDIYPAEWKDEAGHIKVQPNMLVDGQTDVFAVGDITNWKEVKLGFIAQFHGKHVVTNIKKLAKGKAPSSTYKPFSKAAMAVPVGRDAGVTEFGLPFIGGNTFTSAMKGGSFIVNQNWSALKAKKPLDWHERDLEDSESQATIAT